MNCFFEELLALHEGSKNVVVADGSNLNVPRSKRTMKTNCVSEGDMNHKHDSDSNGTRSWHSPSNVVKASSENQG